MQAAMRPYLSAGAAALLGVSVVSVAPSMLKASDDVNRVVSDASVQLVDDVLEPFNLGNVAWNLFANVVDTPYYQYADPITLSDSLTGDYSSLPGSDFLTEPSYGTINALANSLNFAGNWWVLSSTNVLGTDPGDPAKVLALADLLSGNPDIGTSIGQQIDIVEEAWLPLVQGCVAASEGGCPDFTQVLNSYFEVSLQQLEAGYTFPDAASGDPGSVNPVPIFPDGDPQSFPYDTPIPIPDGYDGSVTAADGGDYIPWAGQTVTLDPNAPLDAYWNELNGAPQAIEFPTGQQVLDAYENLFQAVYNSFNPFVPNTFCLPCAPFVPGDTDLTTFFQDQYNEAVDNIQTNIANIESFVTNPEGAIESELAEAQSNFAATVATFEALLDKLGGGFDFSALTTDLGSGLDLSALTADLGSGLDLSALLDGGQLPDIFSTLATDIGTGFLTF